jgi:hypothetical protein
MENIPEKSKLFMTPMICSKAHVYIQKAEATSSFGVLDTNWELLSIHSCTMKKPEG